MKTSSVCCPECGGWGKVSQETCDMCNGFGFWPIVGWENSPVDDQGKKVPTALVEVSQIARVPSARIELAIAILRDETAEVRACLDELLASGVEPDGDEPITEEWLLEMELGKPHGNLGQRAVHERSAHVLQNMLGEWVFHVSWSPITTVRTRRDVRDMIRVTRQENRRPSGAKLDQSK
jgi:hypothetical protein